MRLWRRRPGRLLRARLARLRGADLQVLDEEQQLERRIRERLEGEAKERQLTQAAPARSPLLRAPRAAAEAEAKPKRPLFGKPRRKA